MDAPTLHASRKTKKTAIGEVPVDWEVRRIREVARVVTGSTPPTADKDNYGGSYLLVTPADLGEVKYVTDSNTKLSEKGFFLTRRVPKGGVLFTCIGATIGKMGVAGIELATNQQINAVIPDGRIDGEYLFYALARVSDHVKRLAGTQAIPIVSKSQFEIVEVPFPPLWEQRRIAAVLETWDRALAAQDRLRAAKQQRKQALMQQLLTGQKRFQEYRGQRWRTVLLGDVFAERTEINRTDLPLVAITSDRGVIPRDQLGRNDTSSEDKSKYLRIAPGDIGYNTMRMWQGVSGVSEVEGIVSPAYTVCVPRDGIDRYYAGYLFKTRLIIHLFHSHSQGLVKDTLNLKFPNFARIKVSLPPVEEQKRIASVLREIDREIVLLEHEAAALRDQKKGLMQQLLTGKVRVKGK